MSRQKPMTIVKNHEANNFNLFEKSEMLATVRSLEAAKFIFMTYRFGGVPIEEIANNAAFQSTFAGELLWWRNRFT